MLMELHPTWCKVASVKARPFQPYADPTAYCRSLRPAVSGPLPWTRRGMHPDSIYLIVQNQTMQKDSRMANRSLRGILEPQRHRREEGDGAYSVAGTVEVEPTSSVCRPFQHAVTTRICSLPSQEVVTDTVRVALRVLRAPVSNLPGRWENAALGSNL